MNFGRAHITDLHNCSIPVSAVVVRCGLETELTDINQSFRRRDIYKVLAEPEIRLNETHCRGILTAQDVVKVNEVQGSN
jgi:hypothetical protein